MVEEYIKELKSITKEISRVNNELKKLRKLKLEETENLVQYMRDTGINEYKEYKLEKLIPKKRNKAKKIKDRRIDGIAYFRDLGAPEPEISYMRLMETQKLLIQ